MEQVQPQPISPAEFRARSDRVTRIAGQLGFIGNVEYRHIFSGTGGAQYGIGASPEKDVLSVDARAFERDENPEDFSLTAILAHERGHQILIRHPRMVRVVRIKIGRVSEEVVASVIGALLVLDGKDREDLLLKAAFEGIGSGLDSGRAFSLVSDIRHCLEKLL